MRLFRIRYFLFLSLCGMSSACNSYRHMQSAPADPDCVRNFSPVFTHAIYRGSVNVVGKHISGLLTVKYMPDSSTRFVFSNEMGFSFFDLGFLKDNGFKVFSIIPEMNKKAVVTTLRKDFELILFRHTESIHAFSLKDSNTVYHGFPQVKGINYYITDLTCEHLIKMQRASDKKPVMEATMTTDSDKEPENIEIRHLNFEFTISLKKITAIAN
jgi:hypothetical protein